MGLGKAAQRLGGVQPLCLNPCDQQVDALIRQCHPDIGATSIRQTQAQQSAQRLDQRFQCRMHDRALGKINDAMAFGGVKPKQDLLAPPFRAQRDPPTRRRGRHMRHA